MEDLNHWTTVVKCSLCGEIPETAPLYQCAFQHQYCIDCITELKKKYRGNIKGGSTCVICKTSGVFVQSRINNDFLNKIKIKPGIGRPYRYNTSVLVDNGYNYSRVEKKNTPSQTNGINVTIEGLFQLPTEEIRRLLNKKDDSSYQNEAEAHDSNFEKDNSHSDSINIRQTKNTSSQSRTPIKCPHKPCKKMVAASSFVAHFKYEHSDIPKYNIERGKELCLPCDVSYIEHNSHYCIAMITVYEINKIDVKRSRSSQSVIKTCTKFSQQIPINSFWLMATGSAEKSPHLSYALLWLFNSSDERYQCTIELSSKYDTITLSTYCSIHTTPHTKFSGIAKNLNSLIISKATLGALLQEGPEINLRITVH